MNIGNARWVTYAQLSVIATSRILSKRRLYHLEEDLGLKGNQFQLATSLLYVTYVTCEIPSNLILKKMRPSRWIAFITLAWGMIATLMGLCQNFGGFVACRLLLGVFEAGLFPGLTIYLTMFYTKHELALRVGYLFVSAALAGACGGLLAYGIGHMDGVAGMHGWRWILIFEGIPTVILGIFVYFALADDPEHCYYLNAEEKALLIAKRNRQPGYTESGLHLHRKDVISALTDWKVWVFCLGHFGSDTMLYGYSTFLPTIVKSLGHWTTPQVQALTIPCYILGAIAYIIMAKLSDTQQKRALYSILACGISVIGYGVLVSDASSGVHYLGCFLVACGLYVVVGIPMSWVPINAPRYGKKVTASGLQLTIGNCGGILAPFVRSPPPLPRPLPHQNPAALTCSIGKVVLTLDRVIKALYIRPGTTLRHGSSYDPRVGLLGRFRLRLHVVLARTDQSEPGCR